MTRRATLPNAPAAPASLKYVALTPWPSLTTFLTVEPSARPCSPHNKDYQRRLGVYGIRLRCELRFLRGNDTYVAARTAYPRSGRSFGVTAPLEASRVMRRPTP
jgi:hypothetical protein